MAICSCFGARLTCNNVSPWSRYSALGQALASAAYAELLQLEGANHGKRERDSQGDPDPWWLVLAWVVSERFPLRCLCSGVGAEGGGGEAGGHGGGAPAAPVLLLKKNTVGMILAN